MVHVYVHVHIHVIYGKIIFVQCFIWLKFQEVKNDYPVINYGENMYMYLCTWCASLMISNPNSAGFFQPSNVTLLSFQEVFDV